MDGCFDVERGVMDLLVSYAKLGLADSRCLAGEMLANGVTRTLIESMVSGAEPKADLETSTFARSLADAAATLAARRGGLMPGRSTRPDPHDAQEREFSSSMRSKRSPGT